MREWMTQEDLCVYLQAPPAVIAELVAANGIPCHAKLGQPRFFKAEIDAWMRSDGEAPEKKELRRFAYRGRPIHSHGLTATRILTGPGAWNRMPKFLRKAAVIYRSDHRGFLRRPDFKPMIANADDYLRVACQLGVIDNFRQGPQTHYHPHPGLLSLATAAGDDEIKAMIRACILDVVRQQNEEVPLAHHAIYLLWYWLQLRAAQRVPAVADFNKGGETNALPQIRLNFTRGLSLFLFDGDREKEVAFHRHWERLL